MDKFRRKLSEMMRGRNGLDELGQIIFIVSFAVYLLTAIIRNSMLQLISLMGMFYVLYRSFSKNIQERQAENRRYVQFINLQKTRFKMRKEYKIYNCKGCGRNIRVPKKKGKIEITCPVCGRKEIHRT